MWGRCSDSKPLHPLTTQLHKCVTQRIPFTCEGNESPLKERQTGNMKINEVKPNTEGSIFSDEFLDEQEHTVESEDSD